ncbi:MAG: LysR family transcriptional regulator [Pseudomonadota bacterium]
MNWAAIAADWNHLRAFLATAEEGSLSAAARALGQTQPTIGRQVSALEDELGVILFERVGRSLELTPSGRGLLEHVRAMGDAAMRVSLVAAGEANAIEGEVSITATDIMSAWILPPILKRLRTVAPGIDITIVAANDIRDLQRREADIAIRHVRPTSGDLITRRVGSVQGYLYGAPEYINRMGPFECPTDLSRAEFVAVDSPEDLIRFFGELGLVLRPEQVRVTTTSGLAYWEFVRTGLGLGMMDRHIARLTGGVRPVLAGEIAYEGPIWLTTHREVLTSRRIRLVFDHLVEAFSNEVRDQSG